MILLIPLVWPSPSYAQSWKVAIVLPLKGPLSPIGERLKKGYKLALEEARQRGEDIKPVWIDEKTLALKDTKHLTDTLKDSQILAALGAYSSHETFTLAGVAERAHIPLIIPSSMADRLTRQGYQWVFRICSSRSQYLEDFIFYLVSIFPSPPTTTLVYEDTPWGRKLQETLANILKKREVSAPHAVSYVPGGNDYSQVVEKVKRDNPSLVILVSSLTDTQTLYKNLKETGLPWTIAASGMGLSSPNLTETGALSLSGLLFPSPWIPQAPWPGTKEFVEKYSKFYNQLPDYHSAEAYSALSIILTAKNRVCHFGTTKSCRKKLREFLAEGTFSTPFGPINFTSEEGYTNQNQASPLVIQIQHGKLVILYPPQATTGDFQPPRSQGSQPR